MTNRAQDFADRLTELETSGDVDSFTSAAFTDDVVLRRPEIDREFNGRDGAKTFWTEYLEQFRRVRSTFGRIQDAEVGVLEWTSEAEMPNGTEISYAGVSLLDFDADGLVNRFVTYYDTSAFQP